MRKRGPRESKRLCGILLEFFRRRRRADWRYVARHHHQLEELLHVPARSRGTRRPASRAARDGTGSSPWTPKSSAVFTRPVPKTSCQIAIHRHARGQRMLGDEQPLGEAEAIARHVGGHTAAAGRAECRRVTSSLRLVVFAAVQDVGHRRGSALFHSSRGRSCRAIDRGFLASQVVLLGQHVVDGSRRRVQPRSRRQLVVRRWRRVLGAAWRRVSAALVELQSCRSRLPSKRAVVDSRRPESPSVEPLIAVALAKS